MRYCTRRYSECVSVVHAGSFSQQPLLLGGTQERNTAPAVLPPLAPPLAPPRVQPSLEAPFGQLSWADKQRASGTITVVLTTAAPPAPPAPPSPPAPPIVSPLYDEDVVDYEDDEVE